MSGNWIAREQRQAPRIDVLTEMRGHVAALDIPIVLHDLSRNGFALVSARIFAPGQTLVFRLEHAGGRAFGVTAQAVHCHPIADRKGLYLSGFRFVRGTLTGRVPQVLIDELIEALTSSAELVAQP